MGQDILKCAKQRLFTFNNMNVKHVRESDAPECLMAMANRFDTCPHRHVLPLIGEVGRISGRLCLRRGATCSGTRALTICQHPHRFRELDTPSHCVRKARATGN